MLELPKVLLSCEGLRWAVRVRAATVVAWVVLAF